MIIIFLCKKRRLVRHPHQEKKKKNLQIRTSDVNKSSLHVVSGYCVCRHKRHTSTREERWGYSTPPDEKNAGSAGGGSTWPITKSVSRSSARGVDLAEEVYSTKVSNRDYMYALKPRNLENALSRRNEKTNNIE